MRSSWQLEGEMVLKSEFRKTEDDVKCCSGAMDGGLAWGVSEDDLLSWERETDILDCVASVKIQLYLFDFALEEKTG